MEKSIDESFDDDFEDLINQNLEVLDEKNWTPQKEHLDVLKKYFGHKNFRPLQWRIISSIIYGKRDNCAIMTTGYGKSLCFQFPAVFTGGITIVISPLISLMQDQVLSLKISNISACVLGSANTQQSQTIQEIFEKKYSLVYLTPEFSFSDFGKDMLSTANKKLSIILIAIDEAHCVSSWGHDFRPKYRQLGQLKDLLPKVPVLAVTATATPQVEEDIIDSLKLINPQILHSGFDRPNLYFAVHHVAKRSHIYLDLKEYMVCENDVWKFPGPTIIYTLSRKDTLNYSEMLRKEKIKCEAYNAGLPLAKRKSVHEDFIKDKIDVVVATIAFGMGINKPDIRMVIHYGLPGSMEAYYQEVGRAGRDGEPSKCILFYSKSDPRIHRKIWEACQYPGPTMEHKEKALDRIVDFVNTDKCRRSFILNYFCDKPATVMDKSSCCDNCSKKSENLEELCAYEGVDENGKYDFTKDFKTLLSVVKLHTEMVSVGACITILLGRKSRNEKICKFALSSYFGSGKYKPRGWWREIGEMCCRKELLCRKYVSFYQFVELTNNGHLFLARNEKILETPTVTLRKLMRVKSSVWHNKNQNLPSIRNRGANRNIDGALYGLLFKKRRQLANINECSPFLIASSQVIQQMATLRPLSIDEMKKKVDLPEAKIQKFGHHFIEVIKSRERSVSIIDILKRCPVPGTKVRDFSSGSQMVSINLLFDGLTCEEIAELRDLTLGVVVGHLVDGMMAGYPIKLSTFSVTKEMRDAIIKTAEKRSTGFTLITPIKQNFPLEEVTFDQIRAVRAYYQVRQHLKKLGVPFKEFDLFEESNNSDMKDDLSQLIDNLERAASEVCEQKENLDDFDIADIEENDSSETSIQPDCDEIQGKSGGLWTATNDSIEPRRKRQKVSRKCFNKEFSNNCESVSSDDEMLSVRIARAQCKTGISEVSNIKVEVDDCHYEVISSDDEMLSVRRVRASLK